jgi:hypothetical protein
MKTSIDLRFAARNCTAMILALGLPALAQMEDLNALSPEDFQPVAIANPSPRPSAVVLAPMADRQKAFKLRGANLGNKFYEIADAAPASASFGFTEVPSEPESMQTSFETTPRTPTTTLSDALSPEVWKWAAGAAGLAGALGMGYYLMEPETEKSKTSVYTFTDQTP